MDVIKTLSYISSKDLPVDSRKAYEETAGLMDIQDHTFFEFEVGSSDCEENLYFLGNDRLELINEGLRSIGFNDGDKIYIALNW